MGNTINRTICLGNHNLTYRLERKSVKNLNLHVRKDGSVYVSANPRMPAKQIDEFLISKVCGVNRCDPNTRKEKDVI